MDRDTLQAVARWQRQSDGDEALEIAFHGGEPLVPGISFYHTALPLLREGLAPRSVRFAIQSNLWLLTDELCQLFQEFGLSLGTSLDGPQAINDAQRGPGYFRRTMAGIERARRHGLDVGCICTFTAQSALRAQEVLQFFIREGLNISLHAALPSIRTPAPNRWTLSPAAHGKLLVEVLDLYLENLSRIRISTLDSLCRSVSAGRGVICTFGDCLGDYLAVGPQGEITPCQRFAGKPEYAMGHVRETPVTEEVASSPVWCAFREREERVDEVCGECAYVTFCRGGCPYNALAAESVSSGRRGAKLPVRDPHCEAYQRIFAAITDRALDEVFSEENLEEVVERPDPAAGLLRRGKVLSLMRDGPHPYETAQHARRILAGVALGATGSPAEATHKFDQLGLLTNRQRTEQGMEALHKRLMAPASGRDRRLNNLYLHVTFACPLRCSHCYARAGGPLGPSMAVTDVVRASRQAAELGFRHSVITGGEPLVHPQRKELLEALRAARGEIKPHLTVLRTSLSLPLDEELLQRIGYSTDQVVVSVDGDATTHDARRGAGSYELVVSNLRRLVETELDTDLSLATVLPLRLANSEPGNAVRELARELGIRRTRFRPVLPLGRAIDQEPDVVPETLWGHVDPAEMVAYGFAPVSSCGLGQNLYVEPDGRAYPCYAWHGEPWLLGSIVGEGGLPALVESAGFRALARHTVDTNRRCQHCPLRYLCGGACRAWSRLPEERQTDLDAPPLDCMALHRRARSLLVSALGHLGIEEEQWLRAGLPLPDGPPESRET